MVGRGGGAGRERGCCAETDGLRTFKGLGTAGPTAGIERDWDTDGLYGSYSVTGAANGAAAGVPLFDGLYGSYKFP